MPRRKGQGGKAPGFKYWRKKSRFDYRLVINNIELGFARIIKYGNRWVAEVFTDIKGLSAGGATFKTLKQAEKWMNRQRRLITKHLKARML